MYNQDHQLCRMCDEEPAIYLGLCATCLSGDEQEPSSGEFNLRHAPKREKRYHPDEDED